MVAVYNIGVCAMNFRSNEKRPDYTWSKLAQELLQYLYNKTGLVFIQEAGPVDMKACAPQLLANLVAIRGGQELAQTRRHPVWQTAPAASFYQCMHSACWPEPAGLAAASPAPSSADNDGEYARLRG